MISVPMEKGKPMADYIEKGAAKYAVDFAMDLSDTEYDAICNSIDKAPSADVAPVVHGRWLSLEEYAEKIGADTTGYVGGWCFCSECEQQMRDFYGWNYCPNCGAKMDGDKHGS